MDDGLAILDEAITKAENGVYPMIEEDIPANSLIDN
jgi:hypothetical protein